MSLVDHQHLPLDLPQILGIAESELVGGKQNIHLQFLEGFPEFVCPYVLSCESVSDVGDNVDVWCPSRKLCLPGGDGGERDNDKEGAILIPAVKQVRQECHRLHSLQTVSEDKRIQRGTNLTFPRPISSARIPFSPVKPDKHIVLGSKGKTNLWTRGMLTSSNQ